MSRATLQERISRSNCSRNCYFGIRSNLGWCRGRSKCSSGKTTVRGRPIVQAKPNTPIGCKLDGTVRGTKIWAGDCVEASELRGLAPLKNFHHHRPTPHL